MEFEKKIEKRQMKQQQSFSGVYACMFLYFERLHQVSTAAMQLIVGILNTNKISETKDQEIVTKAIECQSVLGDRIERKTHLSSFILFAYNGFCSIIVCS
jgi:hypothetical protein